MCSGRVPWWLSLPPPGWTVPCEWRVGRREVKFSLKCVCVCVCVMCVSLCLQDFYKAASVRNPVVDIAGWTVVVMEGEM